MMELNERWMLIVDMEPFIVNGEYLPLLARYSGKEKEIDEITRRGLNGSINWIEGLKLRIEKLRGIPEHYAWKVANEIPYNKGIRELFKLAKELNFITVVVTGAFDNVANRIQQELGIDYVFSNELIFNDGHLKNVKINIDDRKEKQVLEVAKKENIPKERRIGVADGANDLSFIRECGLPVACGPVSKKLQEEVKVVIKDPTELIPIIKNPHNYVLRKY